MPSNIKLLKQLRRLTAKVNQTATDSEHKHLLTSADPILNELMLRESPDFYLAHLAAGRALFAEGESLCVASGELAGGQHGGYDGITADTRPDAIEAAIDSLTARLVDIALRLDEARSPVERDYLVRLGDWETTLYHHRLEAAPDAVPDTRELTAATLRDYLRAKFYQWTNLEVVSFAPLAGGFSKKTILFETEDEANGRQSMVMRAEQSTNLLGYDGSDVTREFFSIQLMRRCGLPIAEPLWLEMDAERLGMRFIVSRRARGGTKGGNMGSDEPVSDRLLDSIMRNFVAMHAIRLDSDDPLVQRSHFREWARFGTVTEATRYCVTEFMERLIAVTGIARTPQLVRCMKWLARNVPVVDEPPVIVHIDYAFNNLVIDDDEVTAILDWESSRLGDPTEDIIWTQYAVSSRLSMPEFLAWYRERTGRQTSAYRIAYSQVLRCALNAITCLSGLRALQTDDAAHPVLGTLGFRYLGIFGAQFNSLIDEAERAKGETT